LTGSRIQISAALQRLQAEKKYFSIAVYRIDREQTGSRGVDGHLLAARGSTDEIGLEFGGPRSS
jgi:hypothetical protein